MKFLEKLASARAKNNSLLCVGLDTDLSKVPENIKKLNDPLFEFNKAIIEATKDLVCCYKPNIAFYEAEGVAGLRSLEKTLEIIPSNIPVILDAKRGDIGNTCDKYAQACFQQMNVDAVTLSPYMGYDSISPFAKYEGKALFILVKTSNTSAVDFQDLKNSAGEPLYISVARKISEWQKNSAATLGAVAGATYPEDLKVIREILGDLPILIPGLGSQGGEAKMTVQYGAGKLGKSPVMINSSRAIIHASCKNDFAEIARKVAIDTNKQLNSFLQ